jgi:hypothetical protein
MPQRVRVRYVPPMATATAADPVLEALDCAPFAVGDDVPADELAEVRQRAQDIRAGRVETIEHSAVQRTITGMRKLAG